MSSIANTNLEDQGSSSASPRRKFKSDIGKKKKKTEEDSIFRKIKDVILENVVMMDGLQGNVGFLSGIICSCQSIGIIFCAFHNDNWDNGYAYWLKVFADSLLLRVQLFGNVTALYVAWSLIGLTMVAISAVHLFQRGSLKDWSGLLIRAINILIDFLAEIGFFPISAMLGSFVTCSQISNGNIVSSSDCWTGGNVAVQFFSFVSYLILLAMGAFKQMFLIEAMPYDTVLLSKSNGRMDTIKKSVLSISLFINSALLYNDSHVNIQYIKSIWALVASLIAFFLYTGYSPYYSHFIQCFKVVHMGLLSWWCFSFILLQVFPAPTGFEAAVLLYICGAFAVVTSIWLLKKRLFWLYSVDIDKLENEYLIELKCRVHLQRHNDFWARKALVMSGGKKELSEAFFTVNQFYQVALKKFPTSCFLYSNYANFLFGQSNLNHCLTVISKAKKAAKMESDQEFLMLKKGKIIESIYCNQKGSIEVKNYFNFLSTKLKTEELQIQFALKKLMFLTELRKPVPNPRKLQITGRKMNDYLTIIQENYKLMFSLNPAAKVMRGYASFVSNSLGHAHMTKKIVEFADKLDSESLNSSHETQKHQSIESQAALFDERNAVFVISGEDSNIGEILDVNLGAVDMFGYTISSELIGLNISSVMASPFAENHSNFLRKYLETGFTSKLDVTRTIIARNKIGFLFETKIFIRQLVDKTGAISFIGVMVKSDEQPEYIIAEPNGTVSSVSRNCLSIFNTGIVDLTGDHVAQQLKNFKIFDWLPDWENKKPLYIQDGGHSVMTDRYQMHIKVAVMEKFGDGFYLVELWADDKKREMGSGSLVSRSTINSTHSITSASHHTTATRVEPKLEDLGHAGNNMATSNYLSSGFPSNQKLEYGTNQQIVKSAVFDAASNHSSQPESFNFKELQKMPSITDETLLMNTAMNNLTQFDQLIQQYKTKTAKYQKANHNFVRLQFKLFSLCFFIWIIISNIFLNNIFTLLSSKVNDLRNAGIRSSETLRVMHTARTIQLLKGNCDPNLNIVDYSICQIASNHSISYYNLDTAYLGLGNASTKVSIAHQALLQNLIMIKNNPDFQLYMHDPITKRDMTLQTLRGHSQMMTKNTNLLEAVEYFQFYSKYASADKRILSYSADSEQIEIDSTNLYGQTDTELERAMFFILKNSLQLNERMSLVNYAHVYAYNDRIIQAQTQILEYSLIPVFVLLLLLFLYIFPSLREMVDWEVQILNTFINIPRSLLQWWYTTLLHNIEQESKEENNVSAELYLYLQQNEMNTDTKQDEAMEKKIKEKKEKGIKTGVSFQAALQALTRRQILVKLVLTCVFMSVIPMISLSLSGYIFSSSQSAVQMEWTNRLIDQMLVTHYNIREATFQRVANGFSQDQVTYYRNQANTSLSLVLGYHRKMIYGNHTDGSNGLARDSYFQDVFFGNSCNYIDYTISPVFNLNQTCSQFLNGVMTFGLDGALLSLEQKLFLLMSYLDNFDPQKVDDMILLIKETEFLMFHIEIVIRSARPRVTQGVIFATTINSSIIEPVQLIIALLTSLLLYYNVYVPFMKSLEKDTFALHNLLMIFWAITDKSNYSALAKSRGNSLNGSLNKGFPVRTVNKTAMSNILNSKVNFEESPNPTGMQSNSIFEESEENMQQDLPIPSNDKLDPPSNATTESIAPEVIVSDSGNNVTAKFSPGIVRKTKEPEN